MTHLSLNVNSPLLHPLQVHPIFVLSLADCMLAVLWVVGGTLWLRRTPYMSRVGCYSTSLLTIVGTHRSVEWCYTASCLGALPILWMNMHMWIFCCNQNNVIYYGQSPDRCCNLLHHSNYCGHICQMFTLGHSVHLCLTWCQLAGVWIVCSAIGCIVVYYGQRTFTFYQCKY